MARATIEPVRAPESADLTYEAADIVMLPMHARTYKALADAAFREGTPFSEYLSQVFERAIAESHVRKR